MKTTMLTLALVMTAGVAVADSQNPFDVYRAVVAEQEVSATESNKMLDYLMRYRTTVTDPEVVVERLKGYCPSIPTS